MDVVAEGFQGRDVNDLGFVGKLAGAGGADQTIETDQERGERFTGAGGGGNEDVASGTNFGRLS